MINLKDNMKNKSTLNLSVVIAFASAALLTSRVSAAPGGLYLGNSVLLKFAPNPRFIIYLTLARVD